MMTNPSDPNGMGALDQQTDPRLMPGPLVPAGVISSPQIVSHVQSQFDNMPMPAKAALHQAFQSAGINHPEIAAQVGGSQGAAPSPVSAPTSPAVAENASEAAGTPSTATPDESMSAIPMQRTPRVGTGALPEYKPPTTGAQDELSRLRTTGSGISQMQNPLGRVPLQVLDTVGKMFVPGLERQIPGTQGHNELLQNKQQKVIADETGQQKAADDSELRQAQAAEQESLPELHKTQSELATSKLGNAKEVSDAKQATADAKEALAESEAGRKEGESDSKIAANLAEHGYMMDKDKKIVPLPYEQMSEPQKAVHDLKASQEELTDATAQLRKAQKDNIPVTQELAKQRIANAQHNQSVAMERLGLSERQFEMRSHGTENGEALPGAMVGDNGEPVGTAFQQNVRPTGQERNKADLANSAHDQISDIRSIVQKRPDIFGPLAGRKTDFTVWLGSQDPDAQRFRAARTIAADHLAGVFGGRSEAALEALDNAIGHFKDNPKALEAGLDQLDKANTRFQAAGTVKTAGSNAVEHPKEKPNDAAQPAVRKYNPQTGKLEP